MKPDITEVITDLVFEAEPDLTSRIESQAETLRESVCTDPERIGRWVDEHDVPYLLSVIAFGDEDFVAEFPEMARLERQERRRFVAALESHFDECPHCSLKRGYDLEMGGRVEQACQQNRSLLLRMLRDDGADTPEADEPDARD
jgi:hypothetical protein